MRMEGVRNVLKVNELIKSVKHWIYQESLCGKYKVLRDRDVESVNPFGNCLPRTELLDSPVRTELRTG